MKKPSYRVGKTAKLQKILILLAAVSISFIGVNLSSVSAWAGNEAAFGTMLIGANSWLQGSGVVNKNGVNVYANGDTSYVSGIYSSQSVGMEWQCVELTQRLYQAKGWHSGYWYLPDTDNPAYDIYNYAAANGLQAHPNNGSYTPVPGDMIVHGPDKYDSAGHVAIVDHISGNMLYAVEQNVASSADNDGWATYTINANGTLSRSSITQPILGIVHSPKNPNTNGSPPPPPPPTIATSAQSTTVQGDFNGDGHTDIAVFYNYPNDQTGIWVFWGNGSGGFTGPTLAWESDIHAWDATAIRPVVGDFNGDGKADIAAFYNYGNATTELFVFTSQGTTFSNPVGVWSSGTGNWDWNAMQVAGGDFNGDGRADIAVLYNYPNAQTGIWVFWGNGQSSFSNPTAAWNSGPGNWYASSTKIAAGDVNHDGKTDLIAMYDYGNNNTSVFVFYSQGTTFANPQGQWNSGVGNWAWSQSKLVSGDFNGDGRADLGVLYGYPGNETALWVFYANGNGNLSTPVVVWDSGAGNWDWSRALPFSGDFNGDGNTDVGAFYAYDNNQTGQFLFTSKGQGFNNPVQTWNSGVGNWNGAYILIA